MSIAHLKRTNPKERTRQFRAWAQSHDRTTALLSDEAVSRESITPAAVADELARIKSMFAWLPETAAMYPIWESLVIQHKISGEQHKIAGKPAHAPRLVAAMHAHGLTSILTFDASGFSRYAGVEVLHPADVASSSRH